jgi:hypothetical protein
MSNFWNDRKYEIRAFFSALFILVSLWIIKNSDTAFTTQQLFIQGIVLILVIGNLLLNLYLIGKKKSIHK